MRDQDVCNVHGGHTPKARARVARDRAERDARRVLADLKVAPVDNPLEALQLLAGQARAWQEAMAEKVNELTSIRYESLGGEQLRGEILLFERASDRLASILGIIARLNIDERLVSIAEAQATVVVAAIDAAMDHVGLSHEDRQGVRAVAASRLRGEQKPARRPEPLNLAERLAALERENAELRRQLGEQQATRTTRLAIEAPRPPVPLSSLVVDSPDDLDEDTSTTASGPVDGPAATQQPASPSASLPFEQRPFPRWMRGHPALRGQQS